jgi:phosphoribosyl 1,2-cyclic phosphodiesterase
LRAVPPLATLDGPAFRDLKVKVVTELATLLQEKAPADPNREAPSDSTFRVKLWGTRGSIPVSGPEYRRYGGNTPCIEVCCGKHTLIFDAGSGIRPAGLSLLQAGVRDVKLFFTHFHYDHILGLPFFAPIWHPAINVELWSGHLNGVMSTNEMLRDLMRAPWFPVEVTFCQASMNGRDFKMGDVLKPWPDVTIRTAPLNHPGGCVGYRVEFGDRAVAIISDTEHVEGELDPNVLMLIENADLVVYDAMYTEAELVKKRGFGHSTWQQGVKLCRAANAKKLAIFHHDPFRKDEDLARIEAEARKAFSGAFAARDGQSISIRSKRKAKRA